MKREELLAELSQLRKEHAAAVTRLQELEARAPAEAVLIENAILREEVARLKKALNPKIEQRGVDFPCEECGKLEGNFLREGWYRCKACGYPSK